MNFNKISEAIKNRNYSLEYFISRIPGIGVDGFRLACKNETLKIKTLEAISEALDLPMNYWWEDIDMMEIDKMKRKGFSQKDFEDLKKQNEILLETIKNLNLQVSDYEKMLQEAGLKRKAV